MRQERQRSGVSGVATGGRALPWLWPRPLAVPVAFGFPGALPLPFAIAAATRAAGKGVATRRRNGTCRCAGPGPSRQPPGPARICLSTDKTTWGLREGGVKTLILCVDRDDDLGKKAGVESPIVGRRRNLDAAVALGLADPEDSDTNALLAAIHLHDQELKRLEGSGDQVEVATIVGHPGLGLKADRNLAAQLDEVVALLRPDEAILVSDGAEDEQILPLLQSRVRVAHVHRSIVKQAPRLEGFYYVLTRMLDDEKQAKRFVLPFGIILLVWGLAYLFDLQSYAWGATLAIAGFTLVVQAMKWEESVGRFLRDVGNGLRSGKVALFATLTAVALLLWGGAASWLGLRDMEDDAVARETTSGFTTPFAILVFIHLFVPWLVSSLLVLIAGRLFDDWARRGRTHLGQWTTAFSLIAAYLILGAVLGAVIDRLMGEGLGTVLTFDRVVSMAAGVAVALGGTLLARYVRGFLTDPAARREQIR